MPIRSGLACVLAVGLGGFAFAQGAAGGRADDVAARITGEALTRNHGMALVERLTDTIGGRVTGSAQSQAAAELLLATLRDAGLAHVHAEEWALASRWERGRAVARITAPIDRPLIVGSLGWAPGTPGPLDVPVVDLGTPTATDLPGERVRGAAVLADIKAGGGERALVVRVAVAQHLAEAGAAALLIPSGKPDRLLYTSAFGIYPKGPLPIVSISQEDALLLRRLLAKGAVRLALDVSNTLDPTPSKERNVIAEITGRSLPDEVVLVGGHFDSWDWGQGANDNAAGVATIAEAARILRALGLVPRRTLRFAFFSGEEQALLGSHAYVLAHAGELDRLRAVLIVDDGAGVGQAPKGLDLQGRTDLEPAVRPLLAPLAPLFADGVSEEPGFDTDHGFFVAAGVPAFTLWVEPGQYLVHHHAPSDTFDKVDPRVLALQTAVTAIAAYALADSEGALRRLPAEDAAALLERTGLAKIRRALPSPD